MGEGFFLFSYYNSGFAFVLSGIPFNLKFDYFYSSFVSKVILFIITLKSTYFRTTYKILLALHKSRGRYSFDHTELFVKMGETIVAT